jgi:integrase
MRGDGRILFRGVRRDVPWVSYMRHGVEQRERALDVRTGKPTFDVKMALRFLKQRNGEIAAERAAGPAFVTASAKKVLCGELLDALEADYKLRGKFSTKNQSHLKRAKEEFGEYLAAGLTEEKIDAYIKDRLAAGSAPASINRATQLLGQAYALAIRRKHLSRAPYIRKLSEAGNVRQGFFSEAEIAAILAALPNDGLRDFVEWASETGQRRGEIVSLTWAMLDGKQLRIPGELCKNGKSRVIAIGEVLAAILARRNKARTSTSLDEPIFHRGNARPIVDFQKSWQTATKKAGCPGRLFHDLRRTVARRLLAAGVSTIVCKAMTGHESDSMFSRYALTGAAELLLDAQKKVAAFRRMAH